MQRRSRRIAGLPPQELHVLEQEDEQLKSCFRTNYEWAAFVLFAFILPVYYFTAFK